MANALSRTARPRKGRSGKQQWFYWHSVVGILGGLLLFAICWSGAFATLSHEWDWLSNPALRVAPGSQAPHGLAAMYQVVADQYPDADIIGIRKPLYPTFAADALIRSAQDQLRHVYVDPYTLEITGSASYLNIQRYFRDFHRRFFGLGGVGFYLVCAFSIPLALSLVTGLLFFKRWWARFFDFRLGRNLRAFSSNLHKLAGLWSLWFVLIISITGAWYLFERLRLDVGDGLFAYADAISGSVISLPEPSEANANGRLNIGTLLRRANEQRPNLDIQAIAPDRGGYFYAEGQAGHLLVRDRANKILMDPVTGEVRYDQRASDLSPYWRWSNTADPLHFGNFGGLVSKVIWFLFGLALAGLSLTGALVHVARLQRSTGRQLGHRFALAATLAGLGIIAFSLPTPLLFLDQFGPLVDGERQAAQVPDGVFAFITAWICVTLIIAAIWCVALYRGLRKQSPGAMTAKRVTSTDRREVRPIQS